MSVAAFPNVVIPAGWTRAEKGPRVWLVPPVPGARIVLAPLQARVRNSSPPMFLEHVLRLEAERFPRLEEVRPEVVTSKQHYPGLVVDITSTSMNEHRCYALYSTPSVLALMFLQTRPDRVAELRPVFLEVAASVVLPESEVPPPSKLEPWDEL